MHDSFTIFVGLVSAVAGAIASVAGFGIGSVLTPVLSLELATKLAIAAVSIPHFVGTAIRCWTLRNDIDRKVVFSFGITSALGGLAGASLYSNVQNPSLTLVFGLILIFAGTMGFTGLGEKLRFNKSSSWIAGALSGALGGLVGNQGGIRSAAMLHFKLEKRAFVATATAIGLFVDFARMPVYFISQMQELVRIWPLLMVATVGVSLGTLGGLNLLAKIDEAIFKRVVSGGILVLGIWMLMMVGKHAGSI